MTVTASHPSIANPVRLRFAPSPTGLMHLGNARTALYGYLYARHLGGEFVLRIEDTDRERSTSENVDTIYSALGWLGIDYDGEPVLQSANAPRHRELVQQLLDQGLAYHSSADAETVAAFKREHGHERGFRGLPEESGAVRFRVPDSGTTTVEDLVRGSTSFENARLDDFPIARADGTPLYNFAVAVDDADMQITHIVRGEDHLSNTPKQILLMAALGVPVPAYAHLPLLHGADGKKLGKRHGATSVQEMAALGILPEALCNYLAQLGWNAVEDDSELLSLQKLSERFDVCDVTRNAARFDETKLRWLNGLWVRALAPSDLAHRLQSFLDSDRDLLPATLAAREKFQTLDEFWPLVEGIYHGPLLGPIAEKAHKKIFRDETAAARLRAANAALAVLPATEWTPEGVAAALAPLPELFAVGAGKIYQPLRVALTGTTVSPGIQDTLCLLSQEEALRRINARLLLLEQKKTPANNEKD